MELGAKEEKMSWINKEIEGPRDVKHAQQLFLKLSEYISRIEEPEFPLMLVDALHKAAVLRRVLVRGRANGWDLWEELASFPWFDPFLCDQALAVVFDYCETGGEHIVGGTGLPPVS